jgi:hypothetical protein
MSRVGIEPTSRRLRGAPETEPIAADLGKTGSAFFSDRRSVLIRTPFSGIRCTVLHTRSQCVVVGKVFTVFRCRSSAIGLTGLP